MRATVIYKINRRATLNRRDRAAIAHLCGAIFCPASYLIIHGKDFNYIEFILVFSNN